VVSVGMECARGAGRRIRPFYLFFRVVGLKYERHTNKKAYR
jgi:hypothetical protein